MENQEKVLITSIKDSGLFARFKKSLIPLIVISILGILFCGAFSFSIDDKEYKIMCGIWVGIFAVIAYIAGIAILAAKQNFENLEWTVTSKGLKVLHKKQGGTVFVPQDHISSVMLVRNGVIRIVANSEFNAYKMSFNPYKLSFVGNASEIVSVINDLIFETEKQKEVVIQTKENAGKETAPVENYSKIEEVKQLKELLDQGILTQEEFDKKKKELLGL